MNQMEQALNSSTNQKPKRRQTPPSVSTPAAPTVRSAQDILAARRARIDNLKKGVTVANEEELVDVILILTQDENDFASELADLDADRRSSTPGTVHAELVSARMNEIDAYLKQVKDELRHYATQSPLAFSVATKRMNQRRTAQEHADTISANEPDRVDAKTIRSLVMSAADLGFIRMATPGQFSWDKQSYESSNPADEYISSVAAALTQLIQDFGVLRNDRNDSTREEVRRHGFLIGTDRKHDGQTELPSELDALRQLPGMARTLTQFLGGTGDRAFVRMGERQGEVLLERKNGKIVATRTTNYRLGYSMFFRKDRDNADRKIAKDKPFLVEVEGVDVSRVWHDQLRDAMTIQIQQESQSQNRRDAASELRDVSKLGNPLTFTDLRAGQKGVCPLNFRWTTRTDRGEREISANFQLIGDGDGNFVIGEAVPGILEKIDPNGSFLAKAKEPQKLETLDRSTWQAIGFQNKYFERDWQVNREAERRTAVPVSRDNLQDLMSVENGKDGLYAVRTNWHNRANKRNTPIGFLVERSGSTVEFVYAVPGTSTALVEKYKEKYGMADLPKIPRAILRNLYMALSRVDRNVEVDLPEHLKAVAKDTETEG